MTKKKKPHSKTGLGSDSESECICGNILYTACGKGNNFKFNIPFHYIHNLFNLIMHVESRSNTDSGYTVCSCCQYVTDSQHR